VTGHSHYVKGLYFCSVCFQRITTTKRGYIDNDHPGWKIHKSCLISRARKENKQYGRDNSLSRPRSRLNKRKAWSDISDSNKTKRRKEAHELLVKIGIQPEELIQITPESLLGTSTAFRRQVRVLFPLLKIPCEKTIIKLKLQAAKEKGTATNSKAVGEQFVAYLSDPLSFINYVTNNSSFVCIGIDKGNKSTKIGISYEFENRVVYSALMVTSGNDSYEDLAEIRDNTDIFKILQHLIDNEKVNQKVFLCCDMKACRC